MNQTSLNENELSKQVFVPCLQKISMRYGYNLKNVEFTGGNAEKGVDIEYYEIVGPDKHRFYTGVQVKKKDITQSDATQLIMQGTQAFEKDIIDPATGATHRINRWVVATTGDIKLPAKEEISKVLSRYGKLISFWDGVTLGEMIFDNYYNEFIHILGVDPVLAGSSNVGITWYDPKNCPVLYDDFSSDQWTAIDLSRSVPVTANGVFITIEPLAENLPPVMCTIRSTIDEITVESFMSQISPYLLKLKHGELQAEIRILENPRSVRILNRGVRFTR